MVRGRLGWVLHVGALALAPLSIVQAVLSGERKLPGELVHVDVKKLGRIRGGAGKRWRSKGNAHYNPTRTDRAGVRRQTVGWEFCHVAVDDATRLAYVELLGEERGESAAGFLRRACEWLRAMGIKVERVMSDNGSCYRSTVHATACRELGLRHIRTRPYRPRTNGKAERFIQTLQNRWAHGTVYGSSAERRAALPAWLTHYNFRQSHGSLGHKPPAARLRELEQRPG